jgi:hypothetical protein
MSRERLGARSDFDEWANAVVAAVKKHRSRFGAYSGEAPAQGRTSLRKWASRMLTKIAA